MIDYNVHMLVVGRNPSILLLTYSDHIRQQDLFIHHLPSLEAMSAAKILKHTAASKIKSRQHFCSIATVAKD